MRGLGTFIWFGYRMPVRERARLIRAAGFETVLHWWDDAFAAEEGACKEAQAELIRGEGLVIENGHLRADRVNDLWRDTQDGQAALAGYLKDIDSLAGCGIPVAVLHVTSGSNPPPVTEIGMARMRALAERAERLGVRLAVENVRNPEVTARVLDAVDSPALGLCYDSGHDFVWSKTPYALLARYKSRLYAVHLHDNHGEADEHLAPGEGRIDWDIVRRGIEASAYTGTYTLESDSAEIPADRTAQAHLKRHYDGARARLLGGAG